MGKITLHPSPRPLTSDIVNMIDINKIQSALRSLKEERVHIEDYLQNAAVMNKELDKELNVSFNEFVC